MKKIIDNIFTVVLNLFNNVKTKNKLIIIYAICVIVPVIITNLGFYYYIEEKVKYEEKRGLEQSLERINYGINRYVETYMGLANLFYSDEILNDFLNNKYTGEDEYMNVFKKLESHVLKSSYIYGYKFNVELYVDNDTIKNGEGVYIIDDDIKKEQWYKRLKNSTSKFETIYYFDTEVNSKPLSRTVSVIRKLDNFYNGNTIEKILKVDFDYEAIINILKEENTGYDIFITDGEKVIFSNKINNSEYNSDFQQLELKKGNNLYIKSNLSGIFNQWEVTIGYEEMSSLLALKNSSSKLIIITIFNLLIPTLGIFLISKSLTNRLEILSLYINKVKNKEFEEINLVESKDEIGVLIKCYNLMSRTMKDLIEVVHKQELDKKSLEISKKNMELKALHAQINPHFLFNTLETIRMRSLVKKERETAEIIKYLSKLLRRSLSWGDDIITLEQELDFVKDYLQIQKYRFGDKINYTINVEDNILKNIIPKLSILTFVENCCVHGIERSHKKCHIIINVVASNNTIEITIEDTGVGIEKHKLEEIKNKLDTCTIDDIENSSSIGVLNVTVRMKTVFSEMFNIAVTSEEGLGTIVSMTLPKIEGSF